MIPHELAFSVAGLLSMAGWLALGLSPLAPRWSDRIAGFILPGLLSVGYVAIAVASAPADGGFGSFADVQLLFSHADALLAGWVHFLAFDLVIGAWACRTARAEGMSFPTTKAPDRRRQHVKGRHGRQGNTPHRAPPHSRRAPCAFPSLC